VRNEVGQKLYKKLYQSVGLALKVGTNEKGGHWGR
jgi:hypothetical protein